METGRVRDRSMGTRLYVVSIPIVTTCEPMNTKGGSDIADR